MRQYSLRVLSDTGRSIRRYDFQAATDDEARGAARTVLAGGCGELRTGARTVFHWPAETLQSSSKG